jgi:hypothetical protein
MKTLEKTLKERGWVKNNEKKANVKKEKFPNQSTSDSYGYLYLLAIF